MTWLAACRNMRVCSRIFSLYFAGSDLSSWFACDCAGSWLFGLSSRSWIPSSTCLSVMLGFHALASLRMDRQTLPLGKMLGWNRTGANVQMGGFAGKSSVNSIVSVNMAPSQSVPSLPGMPAFHLSRSLLPSGLVSGRAQNPAGWSLRHALRSSCVVWRGVAWRGVAW